jgi:hypothetical protein
VEEGEVDGSGEVGGEPGSQGLGLCWCGNGVSGVVVGVL